MIVVVATAREPWWMHRGCFLYWCRSNRGDLFEPVKLVWNLNMRGMA